MIEEAKDNPRRNETSFVATCNDGYRTKGNHEGYFLCDGDTWTPNIQCVSMHDHDNQGMSIFAL